MAGSTSFPLTPLGGLPLAVDASAIDEAMRPFLVAEGDGRRWRRRLSSRNRRTLLRALGRLLQRRSRRNRDAIESEYRQAWSAGYRRYDPAAPHARAAPWSWRGRRLLLDPAGATRIRTILLAAAIEHLRPRRVLEVGSGNGINLLSLAGAFPEIEFTGLELTAEGVAQARHAQSDPETLDIIAAYSPLAMRERAAIGRIDFTRGDASAMPFADGGFDLVMTVLAVEQMESIRAKALSEIARVSGSHVLLLEPFREVNSRGFRRLYVRARDYFQGSIPELRCYGLEPLWATGDFPQEAFLGAALVLAKKSEAAKL